MRKIKWRSTAIRTTNPRCGWRSHPSWGAAIGPFEIVCEPKVKKSCARIMNKPEDVLGWYCTLSFLHCCGEPLECTKIKKSEQSAKKDAHELLEKYMMGYGLSVLKDLKDDNLLKPLLIEVGVEI